MPELPEVERLRRELERSLTGAVVRAVTVHRRDTVVIPGDPPGGFARNTRKDKAPQKPKRLAPAHLLAGARITAVLRRGKQLALIADDRRALLVHLGMTGALWRVPSGRRLDPADHVHVTWRLERRGQPDGRLVFRDPRRFGGVWAGLTREDIWARWADLGPDALDADQHALERLTGRRPIKAALLDQRAIAGVGNISADEALFRAALRPDRPADELGPADRRRLARRLAEVLTEAVADGGSTLRDYRGSTGSPGEAQRKHRVYGRAGRPCVRCGETLVGTRLVQRMTVFCPACQV